VPCSSLDVLTKVEFWVCPDDFFQQAGLPRCSSQPDVLTEVELWVCSDVLAAVLMCSLRWSSGCALMSLQLS